MTQTTCSPLQWSISPILRYSRLTSPHRFLPWRLPFSPKRLHLSLLMTLPVPLPLSRLINPHLFLPSFPIPSLHTTHPVPRLFSPHLRLLRSPSLSLPSLLHPSLSWQSRPITRLLLFQDRISKDQREKLRREEQVRMKIMMTQTRNCTKQGKRRKRVWFYRWMLLL